MPPKAQKQILFPINDADAFNAVISPENKKLVVIDLHMSWCGPCNIMEMNYRAMYFNFENADDRIGFYTCVEENIPQEIMTALKYGPLTCKPRFVVYVEGEKKEEINGADFATLEYAVKKFIPQLDD